MSRFAIHLLVKSVLINIAQTVVVPLEVFKHDCSLSSSTVEGTVTVDYSGKDAPYEEQTKKELLRIEGSE